MSCLETKKYSSDKDLSFEWDDIMTVITQQHSLCEKQKGKTFISERFVRSIHTSSSSLVHHLVLGFRA